MQRVNCVGFVDLRHIVLKHLDASLLHPSPHLDVIILTLIMKVF